MNWPRAVGPTPTEIVAVTVLASAFPVPPSPGDFKVGQVWRYKARPGEETSLAYIAWVDHQRGVSIYHLYLDGLRLRNPRLPGGIQPALKPEARERRIRQ